MSDDAGLLARSKPTSCSFNTGNKLKTKGKAEKKYCGASATTTVGGENDRKCVTMRDAELPAETGVRLNIGLPEQRPNPLRDKCRVSEAHLLCGLRFNNWHYNSISHHYRAVPEIGSAREKEQREWEEEGGMMETAQDTQCVA